MCWNIFPDDVSFVWSSVHDAAFDNGIKLIPKATSFSYFDVREPVTLQVDTSEFVLGGALLQPDAFGKLQPVSYMSCRLKPNEVLWAHIEKDALALCAA